MVNQGDKKTDDASTLASSNPDTNSEKQLASLVKKRSSANNIKTKDNDGACDTGTSASGPSQGSKIPQIGPRRTKSMYDHVENDFVRTGKKTHLFRLVVVGTHDEDPTELMRTHKAMIDEINSICHDECATGFFLAYPRQFIHVLEGSEDTLNNYLLKCATLYEYETNLLPDQSQVSGEGQRKRTNPDGGVVGKAVGGGENRTPNTSKRNSRVSRIRMLVLGYFSAPDRFLPRWLQTKFNPPRQVGNIEGGFRKNLFELVRTSLILAIIMSKQPTTKNGEIDWPEQQQQQADGGGNKDRRQDMQLMQYLPSQHLIMYVMKDKPRRIKLRTPSEFIAQYWGVPDLILTNEVDWPIPCRIAPYH